MNDRRIRVLLTPPGFSYQGSSFWQEQTRRVLPLLRDLAEHLQKDNIQCLVGSPFWGPLAEPEEWNDEKLFEHLVLDEEWQALWYRYMLDDLPATRYFRRGISHWLEERSLDFVLVPILHESIPDLERWLSYYRFEPPSSRMIFVSFDGEISEFRREPGFGLINFPSEYRKLLRLLKRAEDKRDFTQRLRSPASEGSERQSASGGDRYSESLPTLERYPAAEERYPPSETASETAMMPPSMPSEQQSRRRENRARRMRTSAPTGAQAAPPRVKTEVFLGAATPRAVVPGSEFVARFAAYVDKFRQQVSTIFMKEAPRSEALLDLDSCQWQVGTKVSVRLSAKDLIVKTDAQAFTWNGEYETLRFDVEVPPDCQATEAILKFDIVIDGVIIATLRPEIEITKALEAGREDHVEKTEVRSPKTAFASYATRDRRGVLGRIRSLQIHTGIDVFVDCLSIRPGEQWKPEIVKQIRDREIFWLFWSRRAKKSDWVEWEWRQALAAKSLLGIQPHPLEPSDLAPPPPELADLQFGSAYECYIFNLRESWLKYNLHRVKEIAGRLFRG
jgi:hypothetical protein